MLFTESAMDHQLNGQSFSFNPSRTPSILCAKLDPCGLLSVVFARFPGASGG
jgi:hypothetical protein